MPAWIVTSSAVVGSSAIRIFGSHASAIAIITRWRIPPESWCGYSSTRATRVGDVHEVEQLDRPRSRAAARESPCARAATSPICGRPRNTGLSEVIGSWKTNEILRPRTVRRCEPGAREQVDSLEA